MGRNEELATATALKKATSGVKLLDNAGNIMKGFQVWTDLAPSVIQQPDLLFAKCIVQPDSSKEILRCKQIEPPDPSNTVFNVPIKNAWNVNSQVDPLSYGDIGMLPHTNVPSVLDFIRCRFLKNVIYTTATPLVVAVNPFKNLGISGPDTILKYRDAADVKTLTPHVFYTSREAIENLFSFGKSQTIIVSGESGAGKTEATKQMMNFIASSKSGTLDTRIQMAVMAANPVLEAFGNAKTIRNNNSSRFGRFMQLAVAKEGGIKNGSVIAFLLEKSRVLTQDSTERSYHIFYQFIKGADEATRKKYSLKTLTEYKFLNPNCTSADGVDDVEEYHLVSKALVDMKLTDEEIDSIWSIVSGVLLLGNVQFKAEVIQGVPDAAAIDPDSEAVFTRACELLFLSPERVKHEILVKTTYAGNNKIEGVWKKDEASMLTQSLAKAMYEKLFMRIIKRLNSNIQPPEGFPCFLGMLDIFGFEVFKNNSLEQLFINITNEMLQSNFTAIVFERESKLYSDEGISAAELVFTSNAAVIDALTNRKKSVMSVLEDQCLAPGASDEKFVSGVNSILKDNPKVGPAKVGANINFLVTHTIGEIQYCGESFLFKNKDVLRAELMEVVQESHNVVAKALFEGITMEKGKLAKGQLIGSQFINQLDSLMALINSTEPHFIRCIKPNETKQPLDWSSSKVLIQLHALSILEALQLRQLGYAYRRSFADFLRQFRFIDPVVSTDQKKNEKERSTLLIQKCKLNPDEFKFGNTMVFLKQDACKQLTGLQRVALASWEPVAEIISALYTKRRLKREMSARLPSIIRLQAHIRRYLVSVSAP